MKTVILAGGTGTRLWPMSRQKKPKQFQNLVGNQSMLAQTIARLSFQKADDIYIATNSEYQDLVIEQTAGLIPRKNIIIEPALRDTAPCIGLIAEILSQKDPDDVMAVIYADHLIQDTDELAAKLKVAAELAEKENTLNIIEVKAEYPNINLGYVKIGKQIKEMHGIAIHEFEKFVEKPDLPTAKKLLKAQSYLWNTGLFVWKISTILKQFKQHEPETYSILQKIGQQWGKKDYQQTLIELYPLCRKISIDYAIMEKVSTRDVRIIPADLGWNDIGTWESIWNELHDEEKNQGNVVKGNVIVDTPDALLVCHKDQSAQIKQVVEKLKINYPELL
jgi:mannose-1-phosphate guanylyltransferase